MSGTTATVTIRIDPDTTTIAALNETILTEVGRAMVNNTVSTIAQRIGQAASAPTATGLSLGGQSSLAGMLSTHGEAVSADSRHLRKLLSGSGFVLPLNASDEQGSAADLSSAAFWGSGEYRELSGESGETDWDGNLYGVHLGVDAPLGGGVLAGVAVSWLESEVDYDVGGLGKSEYAVDMVSGYPYLGWRAGGLNMWASVGYGEGELKITRQGRETLSSDIEMHAISGGGSGELWQGDETTLRLRGEALRTTLGVSGSAGIGEQDVGATRLRMTMEASQSRTLPDGSVLEPSLEVGGRYDTGEGETGAGTEVGARLRYRNPGMRITAESHGRALLSHSGNYKEWGIQGSVTLQPGGAGRGLSFSLSPGYGDSGSGVEQLWREGLPGGEDDGAEHYNARLDTRLGYGFALRAARDGVDGVLTPYGEMTHGATDSYRMGLNWKAGPRFGLNLVGERRESGADPAEHAIMLKGEVRF